jgi:acetyl-CoA carboxylase biotin carboxyl carrier protein
MNQREPGEHPPTPVARLPRQLVRIRAGDVTVEIEWEAYDAAAVAPTVRVNDGLGAATAVDGTAGSNAAPAPAERHIAAPTVGVFYPAPEPGAPPFVRVGDSVVKGQQLAIVETMKLMIPVESDLDGRVLDVLKADGEPVEYGEWLFALAPDEG